MIPDELQVPGYDIEERIGKGGMASVYRARQHTFDRHVALKVLKPDLSEDESFCQRFVQESLIVAKLHHSHIVQVYDVGEFQNNFYIAMEYLNGGDLNSRLAKGVAIKDTIQIVRQAASALDFAHNKGIIHRDIKPDNIMFREDGAAVITDFGIAKELDSDMNLTQTGLIVGTPKYMSPEQIRGDVATAQADIYALGILLFQCLTDKVPFDGQDMVSTAYKHFNEPVPQLPPLVAAFQPIVERMLEKDPANRYSRAKDIVDALDELSGENKKSESTNLDITREFDNPESQLDPTVVHPYNQDTQAQTKVSKGSDTHLDDTVAIAADAMPDKPLSIEPKTARRSFSTPVLAGLGVSATAAIILVYTNLSGAPDIVNAPDAVAEIEAPSANTLTSTDDETTHLLSDDQKITIERLLAEASKDIKAQRLKKPDANNAFNKLQRVLNIDVNNSAATAAMEQIAEEYAKLADQALSRRQFVAANIFLEDARSASPDLNLIHIIQNKLDAQKSKDDQAIANIQSMERSLRIDGLIRSAQIDEDEGRLRSPTDDNALDKYLRVLELDPHHKVALAKVDKLKP